MGGCSSQVAQWCVGLLPTHTFEIENNQFQSPIPFSRERERKREESVFYAPSTRRFRVALGRVMVVPSKSFVTLTWHPSRDLQNAIRFRISVPPEPNRKPTLDRG